MPPALNIQIESKEWHSIFAFNFYRLDKSSWKSHSIFWHSIFLLDFCIQFLLTWTRPGGYLVVYLDVSWCLPGLEPGRKKTFNFEGTKTFNLWNGRLTGDSEGSKSQKTIQFPTDQAVSRCLPGLVLVFPGKKKMGEAATSTHSCVNQQTNFSQVYHEEGLSLPLL